MAKIKRKTKKTSKRYVLYDKATRKNKFCPKCGPGVFLAKHKNRHVCGKCHYMESIQSEPKQTSEKSHSKI